jgi:hypothetical protein
MVDPTLHGSEGSGRAPSVALDAANPLNVAIVAQGDQGFHPDSFSSNGGETWSHLAIPEPPGQTIQSSFEDSGLTGAGAKIIGGRLLGTVEYGRDDSLFASFTYAQGERPGDLCYNAYTTDTTEPTNPNAWRWNGNPAQPTNAQPCMDHHEPWLLTDPLEAANEDVLVGFPTDSGALEPPLHGLPSEVSTFKAKLPTSETGLGPAEFIHQSTAVSVEEGVGGDHGTVRLARDPLNNDAYVLEEECPRSGEPCEELVLRLNRSTDGGQTWSLDGKRDGIVIHTGKPFPSSSLGGVDPGHAEYFSALAVDPNTGDVYIAFEHPVSGEPGDQVFVERFEENQHGELVAGPEGPQQVSSGASATGLPGIAVSEDGTVGLLYDSFIGSSGECKLGNTTTGGPCPAFQVHLETNGTYPTQGAWIDKVLSTFSSTEPRYEQSIEHQFPFPLGILGPFQTLRADGVQLYGTFAGNRKGTGVGGSESVIDPIYFTEATSEAKASMSLPKIVPQCTAACHEPPPPCVSCHVVFGEGVDVESVINPIAVKNIPTGVILVSDGEAILARTQLPPSGRIFFDTNHLAVGLHSLFVTYSGDLVFAPVQSQVLSVTVEKAATTLSLHSTPNPLVAGSKAVLDATVSVASPGAGTPTGTVTYYDNGAPLGTSALDSSGHASVQLATVAAGFHGLTASYSGDESFLGSSSPSGASLEFASARFSGSLTDRKLGQSITLPEGASFNGSGEFNTETGAGSINGSFSIPPFTASLKLFGFVSVNLGLTLTPVGAVEGTVTKRESVPGDEALTLPAKLNLGVTSLRLLGLKVPTRCSTVEPLSLNLMDNLTGEELLKGSWSFSGTTTIPKVRCQGGLLGDLFGDVLTDLLTGPGDPYLLTI